MSSVWTLVHLTSEAPFFVQLVLGLHFKVLLGDALHSWPSFLKGGRGPFLWGTTVSRPSPSSWSPLLHIV